SITVPGAGSQVIVPLPRPASVVAPPYPSVPLTLTVSTRVVRVTSAVARGPDGPDAAPGGPPNSTPYQASTITATTVTATPPTTSRRRSRIIGSPRRAADRRGGPGRPRRPSGRPGRSGRSPPATRPGASRP